MSTLLSLFPLVAMALPLLGAVLIAFRPPGRAHRIAFGVSLSVLLLTFGMMQRFDWDHGATYQFANSFAVLPEMGVHLSYGVDAVAMWLVILTAVLQPICVKASKTAVTENHRAFYAWLTALQAPMLGVFFARDLVFFYTCFEFTLVPMYVLISLFGSTNRKKAATKFFLYTFTGSIIALAGLVYVAFTATKNGTVAWTFDIDTLASAARGMTLSEQSWVLLALMCGFAVKVPLFPVHTWLPLAHTEAPTAGSVVLAGVLLKLGTYAIYRFVLPFVPAAVVEYAGVIATICVIGILYGGLICWVQRDVKKLVAYSSVAHLGFCMLGMFALNMVGGVGSVLYMINHGLSTGALFLCIGMIYERYHTRSMQEMEGLAKAMPVWGFFMVFFTMASVGLPGLNGFVSEFMCLLGAFQSGAIGIGRGGTLGTLGPWYAVIAGSGMIVAAIYLLYMVGKVVFGPLREPGDHGHGHGHEAHAEPNALPRDLTAREIGVLAPLALGCIVLGVVPTPFIKTLEPSVAAAISHAQVAAKGALSGQPGVHEIAEARP
ncbi:MAG: NADH-quinone oxidoreductase subunit M [Phycisphaerae bacterium]|nr:NADH-quinone oxidoreductase subunit M [Phycisphaerae bacterium]